jgi:hypothetical protein
MHRRSALLLSLAMMSCTTVGPRGADEHWRVVTWPGGATVTTSYDASCRTPCNVRITETPFDIWIEREGHMTWAAHYDPAHPNDLQELAAAPNRVANAAAGAVVAAGELAAAGGGLAGAPLLGGAAILGGLPWMFGPRIRRLEVRLAPQQEDGVRP